MHRLIRFNVGQPSRILSKSARSGLQPGTSVLGIDCRIAKGQPFALGSSGRLYRVDAASGTAVAVGAPIAMTLSGDKFGVDFNPTAERLRVVSSTGLNLRLHTDTRAMVDGNLALDGVQPNATLADVAGVPNTGWLRTVGAVGASASRCVEVDLRSGAAKSLGTSGGGAAVRSAAIEP